MIQQNSKLWGIIITGMDPVTIFHETANQNSSS